MRFVGRRYTTRPGAPAIVSCKHDQKVHTVNHNKHTVAQTGPVRLNINIKYRLTLRRV